MFERLQVPPYLSQDNKSYIDSRKIEILFVRKQSRIAQSNNARMSLPPSFFFRFFFRFSSGTLTARRFGATEVSGD